VRAPIVVHALLQISMREVRGVLAGALQSERVEETLDRASAREAVSGSDQASVAPKRTSRADPARETQTQPRTTMRDR
jgi:hypothetical protein